MKCLNVLGIRIVRGDLSVILANIQEEIIAVCKVASVRDFGDSGYLNCLSMVFQLELRSHMLQMAEGQAV
ncbi:hypothetical protein HID58_052933 [Brassica napus]|uniref:Uncharacterized protein n=1 Tax=Brassica napus TaxID=3708 RepID=A0ABQ8ADB5_BRANA|nr:hypothetical protein HID58_052933 [Brassica napus]